MDFNKQLTVKIELNLRQVSDLITAVEHFIRRMEETEGAEHLVENVVPGMKDVEAILRDKQQILLNAAFNPERN